MSSTRSGGGPNHCESRDFLLVFKNLSLTQQISMAAVAGDGENINKQARNERKDWLNSPARANWVKNKQEANGFLRSAPVGGARAA